MPNVEQGILNNGVLNRRALSFLSIADNFHFKSHVIDIRYLDIPAPFEGAS